MNVNSPRHPRPLISLAIACAAMLGAGATASPERRVDEFLPAQPRRAAEAFPLVPQRPELAGLQEPPQTAASSPDPGLKRHAALAGMDARRRATEGQAGADPAMGSRRSSGGESKQPEQKFALFGLGAIPLASAREMPRRRSESDSDGIEARPPARDPAPRWRATQEPAFELQLGEAMPVIQSVGLWTRTHRELVMALSAGVLALVWAWARRAERRRLATPRPAELASRSRGSRRRRHGSRHPAHSRGTSSSSSRSRLDVA
ncbi:exported hypothetical protein [Rubrivivax sp. A210]|nr:exported hypothetical protein [Rubrivivax sp. A210]